MDTAILTKLIFIICKIITYYIIRGFRKNLLQTYIVKTYFEYLCNNALEFPYFLLTLFKKKIDILS